MSADCCSGGCASAVKVDPRYRRVLWIALALNGAMFVIEMGASLHSGSVSLLADSIDFFGDAGNYAISLAVLGMGLATRAKAALVKAAYMGAFGMLVLGRAVWNLGTGHLPEPAMMARSTCSRWPSTQVSR